MKVSLKLPLILLATGASLAFTLPGIKSNPPQKGKWVSLFDGTTLKGWHGYNQTGPVTNWGVKDGDLVSMGTAKNATRGYIITDKKYGNFELKWEWKVDKGTNSGVIYHVIEDAKHHAPYETGPEYQIIDDAGFPEHLEEWQKAGADYAMTVPNSQKALKPVGEWNTSMLIFNRGHVEHWLNGKKIVEFQAWSPEWNKKRMAGKWKDYPDYGKAKTGEIALQDEAGTVYYRHIMIKEL
ncbi:MAG TPA: DUF1080 domain-containing protein [Mucilaginibacter sp.]|nr:DUF1080 domain-containing protein [Mucilaginibacter sp.]